MKAQEQQNNLQRSIHNVIPKRCANRKPFWYLNIFAGLQ